jgi:putative inorganic carbon (HCO3(-)) transporter
MPRVVSESRATARQRNLLTRRHGNGPDPATIFSTLAFVGLLCWVVWTTSYRFPGAEVVAAIGLAAVIADLVSRGKRPDIGESVGIWMLFFGAVAVLSLATSIWLGRSIDAVRELAKLLLIFLLTLNATTSERRLRGLLLLTIVMLALYPARGSIIDYLAGRVKMSGRADWMGVFGNANALAAILAMFLPFPWVWMQHARQWPLRLLWGGVVALFVVAIQFSNSRSGTLALAVLLICIVVSARNKVRAIGVSTAVLFAVLTLGPADWRERMVTMIPGVSSGQLTETQADAVGSWDSRVTIWNATFRIIADRPILGVGPGAFEEAHRHYQDTPGWTGGKLWRDTHNSFLRVWAEMGILGLAGFVGFIVASYRLGYRAIRRLRSAGLGSSMRAAEIRAAMAGLTAFLVTNLFNSFHLIWYLYLLLAVLILLARSTYEVGAAPAAAVLATRGGVRRSAKLAAGRKVHA